MGSSEKDLAAGDRILAAMGLRLISVVILSGMVALVKLAEQYGATVSEVLFFRQVTGIPLLVLAAMAGPGLAALKTQRIGAHIVRAAAGLGSMVCLFYGLSLLPLAEMTTLQFTTPIFAVILGALVLREPTGIHRWAAVVLGFIGVLVVAQPGGGHIPLLGAVVGLVHAMLTAVTSILLRQLGRTESSQTTVFWFSVLSMIPLTAVFVMDAQPHPPAVWAMLLAIGLAGVVGQIALTRALSLGPVSVVVPMDYTSLVWSTLLGWLVFGVFPQLSTWLGAPLIIGCGLYIVWREHVRRREETLQVIG